MQSTASTPEDYINYLPEDRKNAIKELRKNILENLPDGFSEIMSYGMLGYVVPHSVYPPGYHCDPKLPLPFMAIASQKNFIALYHMGIYSDSNLMDWFAADLQKVSKSKPDIGKSKMTTDKWINLYESKLKPSAK